MDDFGDSRQMGAVGFGEMHEPACHVGVVSEEKKWDKLKEFSFTEYKFATYRI